MCVCKKKVEEVCVCWGVGIVAVVKGQRLRVDREMDRERVLFHVALGPRRSRSRGTSA